MKTAVGLPDALLLDAKRCALETRKPLRLLNEEGLRMRLGTEAKPVRRHIRWVIAEGGVPEAVRDRTAMYDWLRDEKWSASTPAS